MQHSQHCSTSDPCLPVILCVCALPLQVHFDGNRATSTFGGAIVSILGATRITDCPFTNNSAASDAGALFAQGDTLALSQVSVKGATMSGCCGLR
jgi:hypothetical protein